MYANARVPENTRDCAQIDVFAFVVKHDGTAVEGQAHVFSMSEKRAEEDVDRLEEVKGAARRDFGGLAC